MYRLASVALVTYKKKGSGRFSAVASEIADANFQAAALLYDMAALQPTERSQFGYKQAAKAIMRLPVAVSDLVAAGTLREVPFVGPASERIVTEFVRTGASSTLDTAIVKTGKQAVVAARRELRDGYLSHSVLAQALAAPAPPGVVGKGDYRGDFQMHSTWSDGAERIATMAGAAIKLGHTCLGITDHSYGLPIARGISMEQATKQWAEIDHNVNGLVCMKTRPHTPGNPAYFFNGVDDQASSPQAG